MRGSPRHIAAGIAVVCVTAATAWAPVAAGWGPPRSNGLGTQTLRGGAGADYLRGAEGPDTIRGNGGGDLLTGDTGPDHVYGGRGSDTLTGGAGIDVLAGGPGNDIAFGGFGADRIDGGPGDDALDGNNDDDRLDGGDGNDILHGGSGIDRLDGGAGDDRIFADSGADLIIAGEGDDTIVVDGSVKARIDCGAGHDTLYAAIDAQETDHYYSSRIVSSRYTARCEVVWVTDALVDPNKGVTYLARDAGGRRDGTPRDDTLLGGPGPDLLNGGAGNDVLWGLRQPGVRSVARDVLAAGGGDDTVYGGPGPQTIDGGAGDDFLQGGIGDGTIAGGAGDDTIRLRGSGLTKVDAGAGNDTIYARGTARGRITCGRGRDVAHVDAGDHVARDCERLVGRPARRTARARAAQAEVIGATPGLVRWWRLGEQQPPPGFSVSLVDRVGGGSAGYHGELGIPGVSDDGDTAFQSDPLFPVYGGNVWLHMSTVAFHQQFTFEAWFRPQDSASGRVLLNAVPYGSRHGVALVREPDDALHAVISSASDPARRVDLRTAPLDLAPGSWHHVALTRADDRAAIYVDGVERASMAATPVTFDSAEYSVGVGGALPNYKSWHGGIDEIAIYDRALEATTVDEHFRAGDDGAPPVARADPPLIGTQPRSGVVHLRTDRAGSSFRCSLDGAAYVPCPADYPLDKVGDGAHDLRVLAISRTNVVQLAPTLIPLRVDASVPATLVALRVAPESDGRAIVSFGSESAAGFECRPGYAPGDQNYRTCTAPMDIAPGTGVEVRAFDSAGNRDPTPAYVKAPEAGRGLSYAVPLPTFAGARAEAQLHGEWSLGQSYECRVDGGDWNACASNFRLPLHGEGPHSLQVRQPIGRSGAMATTAPMNWSVTPRPGDVAIAGLQMQLVVERSARLLRRAPRVRFALSHPARVQIDVLSRSGTRAITVAAAGRTGPNLVKVPARKLNALREGRYTVRVTARGATGKLAVQQLPLAIVPPLR